MLSVGSEWAIERVYCPSGLALSDPRMVLLRERWRDRRVVLHIVDWAVAESHFQIIPT